MKTMTEEPAFYGWKNAALLFCTYGIGSGIVFYGYTVIFPAMIQATGWARGEASLAHSIRTILLGLLAPLVGAIINKYGGKKTIAFGFSIMIIGLLLLSAAITELWHWTLIWGFIMPFGFAFMSILPTQTIITKWFNVRRATVIGLVMTGAPVGGFLAQPLYTWIIERTGSWQMGWMSAAGFVVPALVLTIWLRSDPEEMGQRPDGINNKDAKGGTKEKPARTYRTGEAWTLREAIRCHSLWCAMFIHMAQLMVLYMVVTHGILHLTDIGYSTIKAASVLSLIILSSGLARFMVGFLGDIIEPRWLSTAAMTLMFAALTALWKAPGFTLLMAAGAALGLSIGAILVLVPSIVANYWGPQSFPGVMGFIMPFLIVLSAPTAVIAGFIVDNYGSYDIVFIFISVILVIGIICSAFITPPFKDSEMRDERVNQRKTNIQQLPE